MNYEDDTQLCGNVETDDCGDDIVSSLPGCETHPGPRIHSRLRPIIDKQSGDSDEAYSSYNSVPSSTDSLTKSFDKFTLKSISSDGDEKLQTDSLNSTSSRQSNLKSIDEGYSEEDDSGTADHFTSAEFERNASEKIKPCIAFQSETDPFADDFLAETVFEIYVQDEDGDTKLHLAIIHKMVDIALEFILLAPHHNWLDIPNCLLQTPLHVAAITKQHSITRRLIVGGACVTLQDTRGFTPLHIACMQNDIKSVRLLLTPVTYDEQKKNSYHIPYQKIPQNLEIKNYEGHTCLHLAAQNTNLDMMKLLLDKGAKINCQDGKSGRTCLHYAAETNNLELLNFLLSQAGLNIDAMTYGSQTAMALAHGHKFYNIVKILHERGGSMMVEELEDDMDSDPDMIDDSLISNFMPSEHFIS